MLGERGECNFDVEFEIKFKMDDSSGSLLQFNFNNHIFEIFLDSSIVNVKCNLNMP